MRKRIFINMIMLTATSLILVSAALCIVFYHKLLSTVIETLRNRAETFTGSSSHTAIEALDPTKSSDMRVTIISPDGTVIFDNTARAGSLDNHHDREEIRSALETGSGQSIRFSDTLQKETVYYGHRHRYLQRSAKPRI